MGCISEHQAFRGWFSLHICNPIILFPTIQVIKTNKYLQAVAVNNLGKWKTATQMTSLTILLAARDSRFIVSKFKTGDIFSSFIPFEIITLGMLLDFSIMCPTVLFLSFFFSFLLCVLLILPILCLLFQSHFSLGFSGFWSCFAIHLSRACCLVISRLYEKDMESIDQVGMLDLLILIWLINHRSFAKQRVCPSIQIFTVYLED